MHTREGVLEAASQHSKRAEHQGVGSVSEVSHRPQLLRNLSTSSLPSGSILYYLP